MPAVVPLPLVPPTNTLVVELKGVNHGFCHAVKKELWNDSAVTLASYVVDHPTIGVPKLLIETNNDEDAKNALKKATR